MKGDGRKTRSRLERGNATMEARAAPHPVSLARGDRAQGTHEARRGGGWILTAKGKNRGGAAGAGEDYIERAARPAYRPARLYVTAGVQI